MRHIGVQGLEPPEIDIPVHPSAPGEASWAQAPMPVASAKAAFQQPFPWPSTCPTAAASSRNEMGLASMAKDHQPGTAYPPETRAAA